MIRVGTVENRPSDVAGPPRLVGAEPDIVERLAQRLLDRHAMTGDRVIVGISGAPGAGKSHLGDTLAAHLGPKRAAVVPFDGFHLATAVLTGTPLAARRGALETFDLGAYRSMMTRLRERNDAIVYAPTFRRGLEEPIASAIPVPKDVPIIITEGNYLLVEHPDLAAARQLSDETWYLDTPPDVRLPQLVARHVAFGKPEDEAAAWAMGSDQRNAELIESTRHSADLIVTVVREPSVPDESNP